MNEMYLYIYAVLLIAGGVFGFKKAGSRQSLIAGLASGVCVFMAAILVPGNPVLGYGFAFTVCTALTVIFAARLAKTKKFMPSGMLFVLSIVVGAISLYSFLAVQ